MAIIAGVERRRRWRLEETLRIVAEAERPGALFADVARRHAVSWGLAVDLAASGARGCAGAGADAGADAGVRTGAECGRRAASRPPGPAVTLFRPGPGGAGMPLYAKRLERGRFVWPQAKQGVVSLTPAMLSMLLEGIKGLSAINCSILGIVRLA